MQLIPESTDNGIKVTLGKASWTQSSGINPTVYDQGEVGVYSNGDFGSGDSQSRSMLNPTSLSSGGNGWQFDANVKVQCWVPSVVKVKTLLFACARPTVTLNSWNSDHTKLNVTLKLSDKEDTFDTENGATALYNSTFYDGYKAAIDKLDITDAGVIVPKGTNEGIQGYKYGTNTIAPTLSLEDGVSGTDQDSTQVRPKLVLNGAGLAHTYYGNGSTKWYERGYLAGWNAAVEKIGTADGTANSNGQAIKYVTGPKKATTYSDTGNTENKYKYTASKDSYTAEQTGTLKYRSTSGPVFASTTYIWYSSKNDKANATESTHSRKGDLYTRGDEQSATTLSKSSSHTYHASSLTTA